MTRNEHLLTVAMEECNEVAQRISKALRFGMNERQPGQEFTNRDRIIYEFFDLCATLDLCGLLVVPDDGNMTAKKLKVARYIDYATDKCGTVRE